MRTSSLNLVFSQELAQKTGADFVIDLFSCPKHRLCIFFCALEYASGFSLCSLVGFSLDEKMGALLCAYRDERRIHEVFVRMQAFGAGGLCSPPREGDLRQNRKLMDKFAREELPDGRYAHDQAAQRELLQCISWKLEAMRETGWAEGMRELELRLRALTQEHCREGKVAEVEMYLEEGGCEDGRGEHGEEHGNSPRSHSPPALPPPHTLPHQVCGGGR